MHPPRLAGGTSSPSPHRGRGLDKTPIRDESSTGVLRFELPHSRVPLYLGNWGYELGAKHASLRAPGGTVADVARNVESGRLLIRLGSSYHAFWRPVGGPKEAKMA